jgi:hypothetical protein
MSAAPRTVSTAPDLRGLGLALGAVLIAVAVIVAVALVRPATTKAPAAPAAPAAVQFDHGWSSAASATRSLTVSGTKGGGLIYTGIPYPAKASEGYPFQDFQRTYPAGDNTAAQTVRGYGIPWQAYERTASIDAAAATGGRGTRFEQ